MKLLVKYFNSTLVLLEDLFYFIGFSFSISVLFTLMYLCVFASEAVKLMWKFPVSFTMLVEILEVYLYFTQSCIAFACVIFKNCLWKCDNLIFCGKSWLDIKLTTWEGKLFSRSKAVDHWNLWCIRCKHVLEMVCWGFKKVNDILKTWESWNCWTGRIFEGWRKTCELAKKN